MVVGFVAGRGTLVSGADEADLRLGKLVTRLGVDAVFMYSLLAGIDYVKIARCGPATACAILAQCDEVC